MMKNILALSFAVLLCACSSPRPYYPLSYPTTPSENQIVEMEIESDPPGARIEFQNEDFGKTPCVVTVKEGSEGRFGARFGVRVLRAIPSQAGQYVQSKYFCSGDSIPHKVFFNMYLAPSTPSIDLNVNNY
ncbi:MAG: PEGA domain-containing protein [Terrimicrobiaceae bacterium]